MATQLVSLDLNVTGARLPAYEMACAAIGAHLGGPPAEAQQRDRERQIPTYLDDGCICANAAA
ncbi:hypothetical protein [Sphingomonas aerolata]|uniref:hypothetical protein n=1 Tax=Sphingomonas aerolata TaxID=185951 RepID=UPI00141BEC17|nr:hypothetical protein [Sphingomonas aerolata]NII60214.1 hypothetical protein [Sphingomonas aerolata]